MPHRPTEFGSPLVKVDEIVHGAGLLDCEPKNHHSISDADMARSAGWSGSP